MTFKDSVVEETTVDEFEYLLGQIKQLRANKKDEYRNSPINILPPEYFLAQIVIKSMRAEQCIDDKKCIEELMDSIIYSMLVILRKKGVTV
jgi:hypothetical protein